jgi:hypothetical protein
VYSVADQLEVRDATNEEAHWAASLSGCNATIQMHDLCTGEITGERVQAAMEAAAYSALKQVYRENLGIALPDKMVDIWAEDPPAQGE